MFDERLHGAGAAVSVAGGRGSACAYVVRVVSEVVVVEDGMWRSCGGACAFGAVVRGVGGPMCSVVLSFAGLLGFESRGVARVAKLGSRWDLFPAVVGRHPAPLGRAVFVGAVCSGMTKIACLAVGVVWDDAGVVGSSVALPAVI